MQNNTFTIAIWKYRNIKKNEQKIYKRTIFSFGRKDES